MNSYWISSTETMKKTQFNRIDQNYTTDILYYWHVSVKYHIVNTQITKPVLALFRVQVL